MNILVIDDHPVVTVSLSERLKHLGHAVEVANDMDDAGPRVIEQTIRQKLPEGFQRSEFLLEKGFLDAVVPRKELKAYLIRALGFLKAPAMA